LADLRTNHNLWIAQPGEINDWWRARAKMQLVQEGDTWRVEGKGSERARVAYACVEGNEIVYRSEQSANRNMFENVMKASRELLPSELS
jgi:hypothetical protein